MKTVILLSVMALAGCQKPAPPLQFHSGDLVTVKADGTTGEVVYEYESSTGNQVVVRFWTPQGYKREYFYEHSLVLKP